MSSPCLLAPGTRLCIAQVCNYHGVWLHLAAYLGMVDWVHFLATARTIALCRPIPWPLAAPAFLARRERWPLNEVHITKELPFGEPSRRWIQSFCVAALYGRRIWHLLREQCRDLGWSRDWWMDVHKEKAFHLNQG